MLYGNTIVTVPWFKQSVFGTYIDIPATKLVDIMYRHVSSRTYLFCENNLVARKKTTHPPICTLLSPSAFMILTKESTKVGDVPSRRCFGMLVLSLLRDVGIRRLYVKKVLMGEKKLIFQIAISKGLHDDPP